MRSDRVLLGLRLCKWVSRHRVRNRTEQKNPLRAMRDNAFFEFLQYSRPIRAYPRPNYEEVSQSRKKQDRSVFGKEVRLWLTS